MPTVGKDYRGVKLCAPCWNGVHFKKQVQPRKIICTCELGSCECPYSKMQAGASGINRLQREARAALKDKQMQIPYAGVGYSHINPEDVKALRLDKS